MAVAVYQCLATCLFLGPPAYAAQTPWRPLQALVAGVLIVLLSILLPLGAGSLAQLWGFEPGGQDALALAGLGLWQTGTVGLTLIAAGALGGSAWHVLALRRPVGAPFVYLQALLLMAALQIVVSVVQYAFFRHDMYADLRPFVKLFGEHWALALLVVGVGAPLSEELLFRGFLLAALAGSTVGFWPGALIVTGLWTTLHAGYSLAGIFEVFLIGLYFSWLLWRTGSLRVAIFCHALYNSLTVLALRYVPLPS
jgi:membrane protease YdiL (CAAX protease family)